LELIKGITYGDEVNIYDEDVDMIPNDGTETEFEKSPKSILEFLNNIYMISYEDAKNKGIVFLHITFLIS